MIKWAIIAVVVITAGIFGVSFLLDYADSFGKDTVKLRDGTVIEASLTRYEDSSFIYRDKVDLSDRRVAVDEIDTIRFSDFKAKDLERHTIVMQDGHPRKCRVIRFSDGILTLKDPSGKQRTGRITAVRSIHFNR